MKSFFKSLLIGIGGIALAVMLRVGFSLWEMNQATEKGKALNYHQLPTGHYQKPVYSVLWDSLSRVNIQYDEGEDTSWIFGPGIPALDGQVISLEGYLYPLDGETRSSHFAVSRLPIQSCFFCGYGGPESVVEVFTDKQIAYTESLVKVTGRLTVNYDDPHKLLYTLHHATLVIPEGI
jgi:hypothetical protein